MARGQPDVHQHLRGSFLPGDYKFSLIISVIASFSAYHIVGSNHIAFCELANTLFLCSVMKSIVIRYGGFETGL